MAYPSSSSSDVHDAVTRHEIQLPLDCFYDFLRDVSWRLPCLPVHLRFYDFSSALRGIHPFRYVIFINIIILSFVVSSDEPRQLLLTLFRQQVLYIQLVLRLLIDKLKRIHQESFLVLHQLICFGCL